MKTVMVTAIGSASAQTVIESLHAMGYRVVGCDIYEKSWHAECQMVDEFWQAPRTCDPALYESEMLAKVKTFEADFLISLTDVEMDLLAPMAKQFQELGCTLCAPKAKVVSLCRDKAKMASLLSAQKIGTTIPTFHPYEHSFENTDFPLMLKPNSGRSSMGQVVVYDQKELAQALLKRSDYIAQPYLPGDVWTVDVARDLAGHCQTTARIELLRTGNGLGMTVQTHEAHPLQEICENIAKCIDLVGVVNMEFIEYQGVFYFLEVNPRFSGGVGFSLAAGCNFVKHMIDCAKRERITITKPKTLTIAKETRFVVTA